MQRREAGTGTLDHAHRLLAGGDHADHAVQRAQLVGAGREEGVARGQGVRKRAAPRERAIQIVRAVPEVDDPHAQT